MKRLDYEELFTKALHNALYWQNRCCDLEEVIELFCMDAEERHHPVQWTPPATIVITSPQPDPLTGWNIS